MTGRARRGLLVVSLLLVLVPTACWSTDEPVGRRTARQAGPTTLAGDARYVSPQGRDDWSGTKKQPWRTLTHGLQTVLAGQTLYVREGIYREALVKLELHRATPAQRIEVRAYPGEHPLVRGLFWLRDPSHWTVDGINVAWDPQLRPAASHMVKLTGGVGWVWRNSEISRARANANVLITGSKQGRPARWSFVNNCVHDLRPPDSVKRGSNLTIGDMRGAGPGRVVRNLIFDAPGGRNVSLGGVARGGATRPTGPTDVRVAYNTIHGGSVAIALAGSTSRVLIERNLMGGTTSGTVLRARKLLGKHNQVRDNLGIQADRLFLSRTGSLVIGPGNLLSETMGLSDVSSCRGFRPNTAVSAYGRKAVG